MSTLEEIAARAASYGVQQVNPLTDEMVKVRESIDYSKTVQLSDPDLVKIVRLRLLSDPGFPMWELSYCYGQMRDGEFVQVDLDRFRFPKRGLNRALVEMCQRAKKFGKSLKIFDAVSTCQ